MGERGVAHDFPIPTQNVYEKTQPSFTTSIKNIIIKPYDRTKRPPKISPKTEVMTRKKPVAKSRPSSDINFPETLSQIKPVQEIKTKKIAPSLSQQSVEEASKSFGPRRDASSLFIQSIDIPSPSSKVSIKSSAVDSVGLAAAREAQARIEEQAVRIRQLENETLRLRQELEYNIEEMGRRRHMIAALQKTAAKRRETAIPIEDARVMASQVLRKGYAISALASLCSSTSISRQQAKYSFIRLCCIAFGEEARQEILHRRRLPSLTSDGTLTIEIAPTRLKESMRLLRAEQLLLLEESGKVEAELSLLRDAMNSNPEWAAEVFQMFQSSIKKNDNNDLYIHHHQSLSNGSQTQETYDISKWQSFNKRSSLLDSHCIITLTALDRWFLWKFQLQKYKALVLWKIQTFHRGTTLQHIHNLRSMVGHRLFNLFVLCLRHVLLNVLRRFLKYFLSYIIKMKEPLHLKNPIHSIFSRNHSNIIKDDTYKRSFNLSKEMLENIGFVNKPWYFEQLPSIKTYHQKNNNHLV